MSYNYISTISANITLDYSNQSGYYMVDSTSGNVTVTLFQCTPNDGVLYRFQRKDGSANTITLTCYSGETFWDTTTSKTLVTQYSKLYIISLGGVWYLYDS